MATKGEMFVRWYLRFNGYFSIENFVVHDAGSQPRITRGGGKIPQRTECDLLGVRLPYSKEVVPQLCMADHLELTDGSEGHTDLVICEVKTGNENKPNTVWKNASTNKDIVRYILRFFGVMKEGNELEQAVDRLAKDYRYEDDERRIRYLIFSKTPNERFIGKGVTYITYASIIDYLVSIRGQSWTGARIGVASHHQQWNDLIKNVFCISNDQDKSLKQKISEVTELLDL